MIDAELAPTMTVDDWLVFWLDSKACQNYSFNWQRLCDSARRNHFGPRIGHVALCDLTPHVVQEAIDEMSETLAPTSVRTIANVLKRALYVARSYGLIERSPMRGVVLPKGKPAIQYINPEDSPRFIAAARRDKLWGSMMIVTLTTGLRSGEARGLRWRDVDETARSIHVRNQAIRTGSGIRFAPPKSVNGERHIGLPALALHELNAQRERCRTMRLRMDDPRKWANLDLVFPNAVGMPASGRVANRAVEKACERAGLPRMTFSALRHSFATALGAGGVDLVAVSKLLGHSHYSTTVDIYTHLTPGIRSRAVDAIDDIMG